MLRIGISRIPWAKGARFLVASVLLSVLLISAPSPAHAVTGSSATTPSYVYQWGSEGVNNGEFGEPYGITIDKDGNIFVADIENDNIQKFAPNGAFITKWGTNGTGDGEFEEPFDVVTDSVGNVYVADCVLDNVQKFSGSGAFITKWSTNGFAELRLW